MRFGKLKILCGLMLAAGAAFLTFTAISDCTEVSGGADVAINAFVLRPGTAHLFCYTDAAGERLRFVLARGNDGKVHAVFDACRQCYKFHQGYNVSHGMLICRLCGNRYPIDHMMNGEASCVPVSLPHHEDASRVEVKVSDLKSGAGLF